MNWKDDMNRYFSKTLFIGVWAILFFLLLVPLFTGFVLDMDNVIFEALSRWSFGAALMIVLFATMVIAFLLSCIPAYISLREASKQAAKGR